MHPTNTNIAQIHCVRFLAPREPGNVFIQPQTGRAFEASPYDIGEHLVPYVAQK